MSSIVLDASALLALVHKETGWQKVADAVPDAAVSAVNLAEIVSKLADEGFSEEDARQLLLAMEFETVSFEADQAYVVGTLRRSTKKEDNLSLGDRCCLSLGIHLGMPVLTCDRQWAQVTAGVMVRLVR